MYIYTIYIYIYIYFFSVCLAFYFYVCMYVCMYVSIYLSYSVLIYLSILFCSYLSIYLILFLSIYLSYSVLIYLSMSIWSSIICASIHHFLHINSSYILFPYSGLIFVLPPLVSFPSNLNVAKNCCIWIICNMHQFPWQPPGCTFLSTNIRSLEMSEYIIDSIIDDLTYVVVVVVVVSGSGVSGGGGVGESSQSRWLIMRGSRDTFLCDIFLKIHPTLKTYKILIGLFLTTDNP